MFASIPAFILLAVSYVAASPVNGTFLGRYAHLLSPFCVVLIVLHTRACATHPTDEQVLAYEAHFAAHKVEKSVPHTDAAAAATVSVYFHVISEDSTAAGGNVPYVAQHALGPDNLTFRPATHSSQLRSPHSTRTTLALA